MSVCGLVLSIFIMICMLMLPYLNHLSMKSLTSQFSTFLRDLLATRTLQTAASRTSSLAVKWWRLHYDEAQGAAFCLCSVVYLCAYGYILNTLHDLI